MRIFVCTALLAVTAALTAGAATLGNPTITVDENGNGTIQFPGGPISSLLDFLAPDRGPGGLSSALTYNLGGPPSLITGDLLVQEPGMDMLSEIIRFNLGGSGISNTAASLVFYSDNGDGVDSLADTGFPTALSSNTVSLREIGPEGANGLVYTPTANQPGYISGFAVTYVITSDSDSAVPEPASISLFALAGGLLLAGKHWMKRA